MPRFLLVLCCTLLLAACAKPPTVSSNSMSTDALDGTSWTLARVENGGDVLSRQPDTAPVLRFEDGRVTGSDGCNQLNGEVRVVEGGLAFGPLATTRMACAPEISAVADRIGPALSENAVQSEMMLDGNEMKLVSGSTTLVYVRTGPEGLGPDTYDASAQIQCSAGNDGLGGSCGTRILRDAASGTAELWISNPAYNDVVRYRVLTFDGGEFSAWDRSEVTTTQDGDNWRVRVGTEHYLIPDAVVHGG